MKTHYKKIYPEYFKEVKNGNKTFEVRKNDEDYQVGDILILQEYIPPFTQPLGGNEDYLTGNEIRKEISYVLNGGQWGIEEGNCVLGLKYKGIKLKNIDLSGVTLIEQMAKVHEEDKEFIEAMIKTNTNNAIEEFWDLIQARLGLLQKMGITAQEVMEQYPKHLEKLKDRPRKEDNYE